MIVCDCKGLTEGQVRNLIRDGWNSLPLLEAATGIGSECGSCVIDLLRLLEDELRPSPLVTHPAAREP